MDAKFYLIFYELQPLAVRRRRGGGATHKEREVYFTKFSQQDFVMGAV